MNIYENLSLDDLTEEIDGVISVENWRPISFNLMYLVSDFGRIKALGSRTKRSYTYPKMLRQQFNKQKYLFIRIKNKDKVPKNFYVHQLVGIAYIPNPENKPEVNHKKGIKIDNRSHQLEWNTNLENQRHRHETGIMNIKGEANPSAKLTVTKVLEIFNSKVPSKKMCSLYGISASVVRQIRNGGSWNSVTGLPRKQRKIQSKD